MNMCSTSVEPMASRISTPNRSLKRRNSGSGSDSPADTAWRTLDEIEVARTRLMREQHGEVGGHAEKQRRAIALDDVVDAGAAGGSGSRIAVAPTENGMYNALPSP